MVYDHELADRILGLVAHEEGVAATESARAEWIGRVRAALADAQRPSRRFYTSARGTKTHF